MLAFAGQGAHVVIHHGRSPDDAAHAAAEARAHGVDTLVVAADLSDPDAIATLFDRIQEHYGRLDVLVNSAATFKRNHILDISRAEWESVMQTNLRAPFLCTQHAARMMTANDPKGGVILNISDNSGLNGWATRPHHSISKAGVIMLTHVAALDLAVHNIRVNCVVPGPVLVPAGGDDSVIAEIVAELPLKRMGNPQDIARALVFLARNDFVTGTVLRVDGGEGLAGGET